ncbi:Translation initiation factor eIF2B subunit alpha [Plasmodiophora brassicae]|uniref:Translation initiation factor eIF2B subunit alpha n=1 Tax=Plasmodiophora brassicae TaxID=37360 RepID=A0A0G4IIF8_PLABS|nr:hypothetical protein PBRA_003812 [Plasmodiophora brassicae]SPQ94327.1 unnamed protein product [Plasmodiophora brassicae]
MGVHDACRVFKEFSERNTDAAVGVAAVHTLAQIIDLSNATTMMGVMDELNESVVAVQMLVGEEKRTSLRAACDLFLRYVTRTSLEVLDFAKCKARLVDRGLRFAEHTQSSRRKICDFGVKFIQENSVILVHGISMVVTVILETAVQLGKQFSVILTQPDDQGNESQDRMIRRLLELSVSVTVVPDRAVAFVMGRVDFVMTGASGVVENGGIINIIGTLNVALIAKALNRPFYVAVESYKFTRDFPLSQADLSLQWKTSSRRASSNSPLLNAEFPVEDYTPPHLITLLMTDLGIVTPSAISDYSGSETELQ